MRALRIFVSSPRDVGSERALANAAIERLRFEFRGIVELEPVFWEQLPMLATDTFQAQIPQSGDADICIFILWSWFGTPLPDSFRKPDGTPFRSGTEFEFEGAVAAHAARGTPEILVYRKVAEPRTAILSRAQVMEHLSQREAVQAFIDRTFHGDGGTFKAAFRAFESAAEFEEMLETHLRELVRDRLRGIAAEVTARWIGSPFRGLEAFGADDALIFCGRTRAVTEVIEALHRQDLAGRPFVLVSGASGTGKSSLVRAGVLPMLTQPRVVEQVAIWRQAAFRPSEAESPIVALALALLHPDALPGLAAAGLDAGRLATLLRETPAAVQPVIALTLARVVESVPETEAPAPSDVARRAALALVVDQFEEAFAPVVTADERSAFAIALAALANSGVWVLATMRADFYPRCAELPDVFAELLRGGLYELRPPRPGEIAQMIRRPAQMAGLVFEQRGDAEEGLDDVLREAAAADPAALPLLQFALEQLYGRRDGRMLRFADYEAIGGLEGAVSSRAEATFAALPQEARAALPRVLSALVRVEVSDERNRVTQRRAPRAAADELPGAACLVDAFVAARLFVVDRAEGDKGQGGETVVGVAHEALLRAWPRARDWIAANAQALQSRNRLAAAEALWQHAGEAPHLLLSGAALAEATELRRADTVLLRPQTGRFIDKSERHAARRRRGARIRGGALSLLALAVLGGGAWYWDAYVAPRESLYPVAFTRRNSVWVMTQAPITPDDASHRNSYLRVTRRGRDGPIVAADVLNGSGFCPQRHNITTLFGTVDDPAHHICRWTAQITDGAVNQEAAYDERGTLVWSFIYSDTERLSGGYYAADGRALALAGNGVSRVRFDHGRDGLYGRMRYLDAYGRPKASSTGEYGVALTYDTAFRPVRYAYLGPDGDSIALPGGVVSSRVEYDAGGRPIRFVNEDGRGAPVIAAINHIASVRLEYDAHDNLTVRRLFDQAGHPARGIGGWSIERTGYDERGNRVEMRYSDEHDQPVRPPNGWASAHWRHDARGRATGLQYFDEAGKPLALRGAYGLDQTYDADGRIASITSLDAEGRPARDASGAARQQFRYDAQGRQTGILYFDEAGKPAVTRDGYAGLVSEMDDFDHATRVAYLGLDGKPVLGAGGFAEQRKTYDEHGNETSVATYDVAGHPMLIGGVFRRITSFDEAGRKVREAFEGMDGKPARRDDGIAGLSHAYDTAGNEIETTSLDIDGRPIDHPRVCARIVRNFDPLAREISSTCLGAAGTPVIGPKGFARVTASHDMAGHLLDQAYFDETGKPALGPDGFATLHAAYDGDGNLLEQVWHDATGQEIGPNGTCGHQRATWADGRRIAEECVAAAP